MAFDKPAPSPGHTPGNNRQRAAGPRPNGDGRGTGVPSKRGKRARRGPVAASSPDPIDQAFLTGLRRPEGPSVGRAEPPDTSRFEPYDDMPGAGRRPGARPEYLDHVPDAGCPELDAVTMSSADPGGRGSEWPPVPAATGGAADPGPLVPGFIPGGLDPEFVVGDVVPEFVAGDSVPEFVPGDLVSEFVRGDLVSEFVPGNLVPDFDYAEKARCSEARARAAVAARFEPGEIAWLGALQETASWPAAGRRDGEPEEGTATPGARRTTGPDGQASGPEERMAAPAAPPTAGPGRQGPHTGGRRLDVTYTSEPSLPAGQATVPLPLLPGAAGRSYPAAGPNRPAPGPNRPTGGPSYPTPGPSYPTPGPSYPTPDPSYPERGADRPEPGPNRPGPGPNRPGPGPNQPAPGPNHPARGPRYPAPGRRYPGSGWSPVRQPLPHGPGQPVLQFQPTVHVQHMATAIAFYRRLGAEIVHGGPDADWTLVQLGTLQVGLVAQPPDTERGEGAVELNFGTTAPLDELAKTLTAGAVSMAEIVEHPGFGAQLRVRTPDGQLIKINQLDPALWQ